MCPPWTLCRIWVWPLSNRVGWAFVRAGEESGDPQCPKWGGKSKPKPSRRAGAQRPSASGPLCIAENGRGCPGIDPALQLNVGESPASKAVSISTPWWPRHQKWYPFRRRGGHGIKSGIQFDAMVATASKAVSISSPWWPRHRKRYPIRCHGSHGVDPALQIDAVASFSHFRESRFVVI